MTKKEFLKELKKRLSRLPKKDREERLSFYGEMIDDRVEEGVTEEEAISGIGSPEDISKEILGEGEKASTSESKEKNVPTKGRGGAMTVLLILGSPVWLPLLIAAFAVILSLYAVLWSLVISLFAVFASLFASGIGGVFSGILFLFGENPLSGVAVIGVALFCLGLSVPLFFGCVSATKACVRLTLKPILWAKTILFGKEKVK